MGHITQRVGNSFCTVNLKRKQATNFMVRAFTGFRTYSHKFLGQLRCLRAKLFLLGVSVAAAFRMTAFNFKHVKIITQLQLCCSHILLIKSFL